MLWQQNIDNQYRKKPMSKAFQEDVFLASYFIRETSIIKILSGKNFIGIELRSVFVVEILTIISDSKDG